MPGAALLIEQYGQNKCLSIRIPKKSHGHQAQSRQLKLEVEEPSVRMTRGSPGPHRA